MASRLGASHFDRSSRDQVYGSGLDLKHFHETSYGLPIHTNLGRHACTANDELHVQWDDDGTARPLGVNAAGLLQAIHHLCRIRSPLIDATAWEAGRYRPTPTIVEASQALYQGYAVDEISRSEAGAEKTLQILPTMWLMRSRWQNGVTKGRERPE